MIGIKLALCAVFLVAATASAAPIRYYAVLSGAAEAPPNASPGTGLAFVTYDPATHQLEVEATFANLMGGTTAAHIHAPTPFACAGLPLPLPAECTTSPTGTAGVATMVPSFLNFPLGLTAGVMPATVFDLTLPSSWNPNFVNNQGGGTLAGAEAVLANALATGRSYFNVHTSIVPSGEIRGFLAPVPEPGSVFGVASGVALLYIVRRRKLV
jgi:hypothetical protein